MRWRLSRAGIDGGRPRPPVVAVVDADGDVKVYVEVDVAGTPFHTSRGLTPGPERRTPLSASRPSLHLDPIRSQTGIRNSEATGNEAVERGARGGGNSVSGSEDQPFQGDFFRDSANNRAVET